LAVIEKKVELGLVKEVGILSGPGGGGKRHIFLFKHRVQSLFSGLETLGRTAVSRVSSQQHAVFSLQHVGVGLVAHIYRAGQVARETEVALKTVGRSDLRISQQAD
jgi:hypothetical protein